MENMSSKAPLNLYLFLLSWAPKWAIKIKVGTENRVGAIYDMFT